MNEHHIVQFSGGAASAYVAVLLAPEISNLILLNSNPGAEHPDTQRFMNDVADYVGISITHADSGMDLWECIRKNNCLPGFFRPFCTRQLKTDPSKKFYKSLNGRITIYNGFDAEEGKRVMKAKKHERSDYIIRSPLFERGITSQIAKNALMNLGIKLPPTYSQGFKHNNCLPCFKGNKKQFKRVWKYYPDQFQKAIEAEEYTGYTIFRGISLKQLAIKWSAEITIEDFLNIEDQPQRGTR